MGLRAETEQYIGRLQALAKTIAEIDCLQSLSVVAENKDISVRRLQKAQELLKSKGDVMP